MFRLLQATPTEVMAQRLIDLLGDSLAGEVTKAAMAALRRDGGQPNGLLAALASAGVAGLADRDAISGSVAVLIEELLDAVDEPA